MAKSESIRLVGYARVSTQDQGHDCPDRGLALDWVHGGLRGESLGGEV